jgi:hypothetical protein
MIVLRFICHVCGQVGTCAAAAATSTALAAARRSSEGGDILASLCLGNGSL